MRSLANFLGVEEGEVFGIKGFNHVKFKVEDNILYSNKNDTWISSIIAPSALANAEIIHHKTFTQFEINLCKNLSDEYKDGYIARDKNRVLCIYRKTPSKNVIDWTPTKGALEFLNPFNHLFQSIQWSDSEPTKISDIIKSEGE